MLAFMPKDARRDLQIIELARRNGGVVSWRQLQSLGVSARGVQSRMRRGMLRRISRGVYGLPTATDDWMQRARGACLAAGPGAVLSGSSAARLWGLELPLSEVIEVTVPCNRDDRRSLNRDVVIRRTRYLPKRDRARRSGVPVTSCARTFVDLAARYGPEVLRNALDKAITNRVLHPLTLAAVLRDARLRARPGSRTLRLALEPWLLRSKPESVPEADIYRAMVAAGIPAPVCQHKVFDAAGNFVARLDFAWLEEKVAVEMDGFRYHATPDAYSRDRDRDLALGQLGWIVIRITPSQLAKSSGAFLKTLQDRLVERGACL
jgi:hypothetical protein